MSLLERNIYNVEREKRNIPTTSDSSVHWLYHIGNLTLLSVQFIDIIITYCQRIFL